MPLTDTAVRKAQPGEKPYKLGDEKGLFLLVGTKPGALYWRFKYRFSGKEKLLALGVYPEVSLKLARQKRDEARRTAKIARKVAADSSFEVVAREWHEKQKGEWVETYAAKVLTSLE
ncbi:MAG: DUF4102 domain-containing protein [Proteobacteria bacterium]|nr:DUF4102 domain-containing protein [Pseudomonadota bacterium]